MQVIKRKDKRGNEYIVVDKCVLYPRQLEVALLLLKEHGKNLKAYLASLPLDDGREKIPQEPQRF